MKPCEEHQQHQHKNSTDKNNGIINNSTKSLHNENIGRATTTSVSENNATQSQKDTASTTMETKARKRSTANRANDALKQLFCGGIAGSVGKTLTAPFSRLTILYQVHSLVTTKEHRPKFAMTLRGGLQKVVERGGFISLWRGNGTSVLHRFPYSAINFFMYEYTLDFLKNKYNTNNIHNSNSNNNSHNDKHFSDNTKATLQRRRQEEKQRSQLHGNDSDVNDDYDDVIETEVQLANRLKYQVNDENAPLRRLAKRFTAKGISASNNSAGWTSKPTNANNPIGSTSNTTSSGIDAMAAGHKVIAGAVAGLSACIACYPLDLVRTRLTTQLEGREHYRGISDAINKIYRTEGVTGFYSGISPTLLVAVPNFAISYGVYGTLKEYTLDDELFYNLQRIDAESGEKKLGFLLTVLCGAASGTLATLVTFPMDTIRRRMQIQNLHITEKSKRLSSMQQFYTLCRREGFSSLYRGLTPELMKVIPMVGSMFYTYEFAKEMFKI